MYIANLRILSAELELRLVAHAFARIIVSGYLTYKNELGYRSKYGICIGPRLGF